MENKLNELNNLKEEIEDILDFCDKKATDLLKELIKLENETK